MPNKLQSEQTNQGKMEQNDNEKIDNLVRKQVIAALGTPIDLRSVQVRKVWDDHYRVNVYVGPSAASVKVANSYFLVIDSEGGLVSSTPTITKLY